MVNDSKEKKVLCERWEMWLGTQGWISDRFGWKSRVISTINGQIDRELQYGHG